MLSIISYGFSPTGQPVPLRLNADGTMGQATPDIIDVTPVVTVGAYSAADVVGGVLTIPSAVLNAGGKAVLYSVAIYDKDNEKAEGSLLFFRASPTSGLADNAAFAWGAGDDVKILNRIDVIASDYKTFASRAIAKPSFAPFVIESDTTDLFAYFVTDGTPSYGSTADLTFKFGLLR